MLNKQFTFLSKSCSDCFVTKTCQSQKISPYNGITFTLLQEKNSFVESLVCIFTYQILNLKYENKAYTFIQRSTALPINADYGCMSYRKTGSSSH